ncbi:MAG: hypothetical protein Greene07147_298 [Parcubacteria group bacterium Greene0714_7]|nr:MAG: hypothetical protein Greene07147_298 [Parcubacteria group bacterium Greene0714_7]
MIIAFFMLLLLLGGSLAFVAVNIFERIPITSGFIQNGWVKAILLIISMFVAGYIMYIWPWLGLAN